MSSSYGSDDEEMKEGESPAVNKMKHLSNDGLAQELFNQQLAYGPGPIGLNLTKSPAFLELIQRELDKADKAKGKQAAESSGTRSLLENDGFPHFEGSLLRIGDWKWVPTFKGDLVAKFYFAKNKIVWEMICEGLKNKIEIKFLHISALKVTRPNGLPGTLEITVSGEPNFYREIAPRPRRCTTWNPTTDFTNGQARAHRHFLQCEPGIIDRHVDNLLSRDQRLYSLSQARTNNLESAPLEQCYPASETLNSWAQQNSYPTADGYQFGTEQIAQPSSAAQHIPTGTTTGVLNPNGNHYGGSSLSALLPSSVDPSWVGDQSNSNMFSWDNYFQTASATTAQPFTSNGGNTGGMVVNHINNKMSSGSLHRGLDVSSSSVVLPEVIRRNPDDGTPIQPVARVNHAINTGHGVLFPSSVPVTVNTAATQAQLTRSMFDWKTLLQTPPQMYSHQTMSNANAGIMNSTDTGNLVSNQINPGSFHSSGVDQSSSRMVLPGDNTMNSNQQQVNPWSFSGIDQSSSRMVLPGGISMNSNHHHQQQQVTPWSFQSSSVGQSSSRMMLPGDSSRNSNHQHLQQVNPWIFQRTGVNQSRMTLPGDNSMNTNQQVNPWSFPSSDIGQSSSRMALPDSNQQVYPWSYPSSGVGESSSRMALPNGNNRGINHHQINPWSLHSSGTGEPSSVMAPHADNQKQKQVEPWPELLDDALFTDDDFNGGSRSQSFQPDVERAAYDRMYRELIDEEAVDVAAPAVPAGEEAAAAPAVPAGEEVVAVATAPAVPAGEEAVAVAPAPAVPAGEEAAPAPAVPAGEEALAVAAAPAVPAGEEALAVAAAPAVPAGEEALASAPNSLPRLNGQPAPPSAPSSSQSSSSLQANNAAQDAAPPTQVTDAAAGSGSRSDGDGDDIDDWLAPLIDWPNSP